MVPLRNRSKNSIQVSYSRSQFFCSTIRTNLVIVGTIVHAADAQGLRVWSKKRHTNATMPKDVDAIFKCLRRA